uniref:AlNc14C6G838 protein n=1 Tax=Albugo laibachii Nc14 TaxID=890382 RepID=F0W162_9STRA|nr:AlNc14C6G838 [Albugo laibachii Nc14]|eukprot:CCA14787.1 AlNc14C6G838 [Albugo laibachii Nc14]
MYTVRIDFKGPTFLKPFGAAVSFFVVATDVLKSNLHNFCHNRISPRMRRESQVEKHGPPLHEGDLSEALLDKSPPKDLHVPSTTKICGALRCLVGVSPYLVGLLFHRDSLIMMNAQTYMRGNVGNYYLTSTQSGHFDATFDRGVKEKYITENELSADVSFARLQALKRNVRSDIDEEFIRLPKRFYDRMRADLIQLKFLKDSLTHDQIQGNCEKLSFLGDPTSSLSNLPSMKLTL